MDFSSFRKNVSNGKASVRELINDFFESIDKYNPKINAYTNLTKDIAYNQADKIDKEIENKQSLSILSGVPIAIKDNICTKGVLTTCSSKMLENFVAPYESTATKKLWLSGGIF